MATSFVDATVFLYSGDHPIQIGVAPEALDPRRIAVLRGKVLGPDGAPLPGITITVVGHPKYGETRSRAVGVGIKWGFWGTVGFEGGTALGTLIAAYGESPQEVQNHCRPIRAYEEDRDGW